MLIVEAKFEKLILLPKQEVRIHLSTLLEAGLLEVQEIVRFGAQERAKNYNLWTFNEYRARTAILEDIYKVMSRIYQRLEEERLRKKGILVKAQRTDVSRNMFALLSATERKQYAEWKAIEERLLGQIARLDWSVLLLRDM